MASLWKHPQSKFWTACFSDHTGKQRKRSTKEVDRKKAMRLAEMFEEAHRKARTSAQMQKVMADIHREVTGEELKITTLSDFRSRWLAAKTAEGCAGATLKFYTHTTERFIGYLGEVASRPITDVTRLHVEEFRNSLAVSLAPKTINHQIKGLRMLFKSAIEAELLTTNPAEFVKTISAKRAGTKRKSAFTLDQVRKIIPHCDAEWKSMVMLGYYTGQRLGDLQFLKWGNVSFTEKKITLSTRKTGKSMQIPLAPALLAHLRTLERPKDDEAYVHPRLAARKSNTLSGAFTDILISAGIRQPGKAGDKRDHSQISFHSLRHAAVSALKAAGVSQAATMEFIGHDSAEMSERYTHVGLAALEQAAAAIPKI